MDEKVLNLLSLCLQAKKIGYDVFFEYSPHVDLLSIRKYPDGHIYGAGKKWVYEINEDIRLTDEEKAIGEIEKAEQKVLHIIKRGVHCIC